MNVPRPCASQSHHRRSHYEFWRTLFMFYKQQSLQHCLQSFFLLTLKYRYYYVRMPQSTKIRHCRSCGASYAPPTGRGCGFFDSAPVPGSSKSKSDSDKMDGDSEDEIPLAELSRRQDRHDAGSQETVLTANVVPMILTLQTQIVALPERIDNMQEAHCHTAPSHPVPAQAIRATSQIGEMHDTAGISGQPPQASGTAASNTAHREGDIMAEVARHLMELGVEEFQWAR